MSRYNVALNQEADDLLQATINFAAAGDNVIIAAGNPLQSLLIYKLFLVIADATDMIFTGVVDSGPMPLVANQAIVLDFDTKPWFVTAAGIDWIINSSNPVQVSGLVHYKTLG